VVGVGVARDRPGSRRRGTSGRDALGPGSQVGSLDLRKRGPAPATIRARGEARARCLGP